MAVNGKIFQSFLISIQHLQEKLQSVKNSSDENQKLVFSKKSAYLGIGKGIYLNQLLFRIFGVFMSETHTFK